MFPKRLINGYQNFVSDRFSLESQRYQQLAEKGQKPEIMVISCCDSRVAPEVVFDAGPGELFVVRNVANLVPPCENDKDSYHGTSAALEYAVQSLKVKSIIVLGHAYCGGISAYTDDNNALSPGDFIGKWVSQIEPAAHKLRCCGVSHKDEDYPRMLELAVIKHSMDNLLSFPYVKERVLRKELEIHGAFFGVATGKMLVLNRQNGIFEPVISEHETPNWADILTRFK